MPTFRIALLLLLPLFIQACKNTSSDPFAGRAYPASPAQSSGALNFNWRLTGDRTVGPLQVFADREHVWIEWRPQQQVPVISAQVPQGEQILEYVRKGDITVVSGQWDHLYFRRGKKEAQARRVQPLTQDVLPEASAQNKEASGAVNLASVQIASPAPSNNLSPADLADSADSAATVITSVADAHIFDLRPEDVHIRASLSRWAKLAGWHFLPEHWSVDIDVPIAGYTSFNDGFEQAVKGLMSATELSDRPLQACFYSNRVLRIVTASSSCDPSLSLEDPQ